MKVKNYLGGVIKVRHEDQEIGHDWENSENGGEGCVEIKNYGVKNRGAGAAWS